MFSLRTVCSVVSFALLASLSPWLRAAAAPTPDSLPVELAMREFQARYTAINAGLTVAWPDCMGGTKAPAFPPDGFYKESQNNRTKVYELVSAVRSQLANSGLLNKFVVPPTGASGDDPFDGVGTLETVSSRYFAGSIPTVTEENCDRTLGSMLKALQDCIYMQKSVSVQVAGIRDVNLSQVGGDPVDFARNIVVPAFNAAPLQSTAPGTVEYRYTEHTWTVDRQDPLDDIYYARISLQECVATGDLGPEEGETTLFMKVLPPNGAGMPNILRSRFAPHDKTDGLYHAGMKVSATGPWTSGSLPAPFQVGAHFWGENGFPINVPPSPLYGWRVRDSIRAIKRAKFDATADDVDCSCSCGAGSCAAGTTTPELHSLHVHMGLGKGLLNKPAGVLFIDEDEPSAKLDSPACLQAVVGSGSVIRVGGVIRQIKTDELLADVVTLSSNTWAIQLYHASQVGPLSGGLYTQSGKVSHHGIHFETHWQAGVFESLTMTESGSLGDKTQEFAWSEDAAGSTWSLSVVDPVRGLLRMEELTESVNAETGITEETRSVYGPALELVSRSTRTLKPFDWGEETIHESRESLSAMLGGNTPDETTEYDYYTINDAASGASRGKLSGRWHAGDTGWELYFYDTYGRLTKVRSQFLNASRSAQDGDSRVVAYEYLSQDLNADSKLENITISTASLLGVVTGRTFDIWWSGTRSAQNSSGAGISVRDRWSVVTTDATITTAAAAIASPTSLITKTRFDSTSGRERIVQHPDGTTSVTEYSADMLTTTTFEGAPDANKNRVIDGTKTVSVINAKGGFVSSQTVDVLTNLVIDRKTATAWDAFGRPTTFTYLDGTTSATTYTCCGVSSETDRQGIVTSYVNDALKRVREQTRAGITTRYELDALGRATRIERIAGGTTIVKQQTTCDGLGNVLSSKDALERETILSIVREPSGELLRTTTFPGGGTRDDIYAADGSLAYVGGTAAAPLKYEYGVDADGVFTKEIRAGENQALTEWTKTYADFAGRTFKTFHADGAFSQSFFNAKGQLERTRDPDGVLTLFAYNTRGEQETVALDLNRNSVIDYSGTDRISKVVRAIVSARGTVVDRRTTTRWTTDNAATTEVVSTDEASVDGRFTWQTRSGLTASTAITYGGSGARTETAVGIDNTTSTRLFANDRLASQTVSHTSLGTLTQQSFIYDAFGRLETATDARTGTTTYTYYDDGTTHTVTTPDPDSTRSGPGYDPQTTTYEYDAAGRLWKTTHPDTGVVTQEYHATGLLKKVSGARTYPQEYTYDTQGRLKTLKTWQDYAGDAGAAITTWNYHPQRGWLDNKRYADNQGPTYTYWPSGRLHTRTWARGVTTTYTFGDGGDLTTVDYSDSTPDVVQTHDRCGRLATTTDAAGLATRSYTAFDQLDDEVYSGTGVLSGLSITRGFDALSRPQSVAAPSTASTSYGYDAASRLQTVTTGANTATYAFAPNSALVESVIIRNSGNIRLTTTKAYDALNRLAGITNALNAQPSTLDTLYAYNSANQRTRATREDASYWDYGYDALGQVTSGRKRLADDAIIAGHDFAWTYDDIGNRETSTVNGQSATYTPDTLNRYPQRTVPGAIDVTGSAATDVIVTVTYPAPAGPVYPTQRQGERYHAQPVANNTSAARADDLTTTGVLPSGGSYGEDLVVEDTRPTFVAQTPESFGYDADGNLTSDGRWSYTWDAENRLIALETSASALAAGVVPRKLEFAYDAMGRRVSKKVSNGTGGAWTLASHSRFLYDGWNMIAELNALSADTVLRACSWGLDLSGSAQGAGGVGGLLFVQTGTATYAPAYDGNGNIVGAIETATTTGTLAAEYDYNAFGETIRATGPAAPALPFGFSTKYTDSETGFAYYGFRYYNPSTGRWLNRDPIGEQGGVNLYGMVGNDAANGWDYLGLADCAAEKSRYESQKNAVDSLKRKIENLKAAIERGIRNILNNGKMGSPPLPTEHRDGMSNAESVPGHVNELARYWDALEQNKKQLELQQKWLEAAQNAYVRCLEEVREKCRKENEREERIQEFARIGEGVSWAAAGASAGTVLIFAPQFIPAFVPALIPATR